MQEISYFFDSVRGEKELGDFKRRTKIERIKQVRLQEQEISKRLLKENLKKAEDLKKEKDKLYKYEEYLKKLQEIEQLNKLKEQNLIEIGILTIL